MKSSWDSTTDEFLDLPWHILEFATTEEHNKRKISVVGQSGCGLSINIKYVGKERTLPKILAISQHAVQLWCWKLKQGQYSPEWEAVARPQQRIRAKKITSKLEMGLNFAVSVDFWVCNDDLKKKKLKAKTRFLLFFYDVKNSHFCSCPNSNADILQKLLIFLRLLGI